LNGLKGGVDNINEASLKFSSCDPCTLSLSQPPTSLSLANKTPSLSTTITTTIQVLDVQTQVSEWFRHLQEFLSANILTRHSTMDFFSRRSQSFTEPGALITFYEEASTDNRGRHLTDILRWGVNKLESSHDYIQTLFPR
jgi:hypothetical protein